MKVEWQGASGKFYQMELCRYGMTFYSDSGVYIFCKETSPGQWNAIYVGECEDFNERLNLNVAHHHQGNCIMRNGASMVCVFQVNGGKEARTKIETDLRKKLNPPCNQQ